MRRSKLPWSRWFVVVVVVVVVIVVVVVVVVAAAEGFGSCQQVSSCPTDTELIGG